MAFELIWRVALDNDPYDPSPDFIEIPAHIQGVNFGQLRGSRFGQVQAATISLQCLNLNGILDPNWTSGPYYGRITEGKLMHLVVRRFGFERTAFTGYIHGLPRAYPHLGQLDEVEILATDGSRRWKKHDVTRSFVQQLTGDRLVAIADDVEWPGAGLKTLAGWRAIEDGSSELLALEVEKMPAREAAELGVMAEGCLTYFNRKGELAHVSRNSTQTGRYATPQATFGVGGIHYTDVKPQNDDEETFNRAEVQRVGGVLQEAEDSDSVRQHGRSCFDDRRNLQLTTDAECADQADYIVALSKDPRYAFRSIEVDMTDETQPESAWDVALEHEIGYMERVVKSELMGYDFEQLSNLMSYRHTIDCREGDQWMASYGLSLADPYLTGGPGGGSRYWRMGTSTLNINTIWGL